MNKDKITVIIGIMVLSLMYRSAVLYIAFNFGLSPAFGLGHIDFVQSIAMMLGLMLLPMSSPVRMGISNETKT